MLIKRTMEAEVVTEGEKLEPTILGAAWRHKLIVVAWIVAAMSVLAAYVLTRPTHHEATASFVLDSTALADIGGVVTADRYVADQVALLASPAVATAAEASLDPADRAGSGEALFRHISVRSSSDNSKVDLTVSGDTAEQAIARVEAVLAAYQQLTEQSASAQSMSTLLQREIDSVSAQLTALDTEISAAPADGRAALLQEQSELLSRRAALQQRVDDLTFRAGANRSPFVITAPPKAFEDNGRSGAAKLAIVAATLGLLLGGAHAYALAIRRRRFEDRLEPQQVLGAPLIAEIRAPARSKRGKGVAHDAATEALRFAARTQLGIGGDDGHARPGVVIAVTSARAGSGSTPMVANVGIALAKEGLRVLLIDAAPRRAATGRSSRSLTARFVLPEGWQHGLDDVAEGRVALLDGLVELRPFEGVSLLSNLTSTGGSRQLPPGTESAPVPATTDLAPKRDEDRARRQGLPKVLFEARELFDCILIDPGPVLEIGSSTEPLQHADRVVMVVPHRELVERVDAARARLSLLGTNISGYLYTHVPTARSRTRHRLRR